MSLRTRNLLGVLLILASFPFMASAASLVSGLGVVGVGVVAYVVLGLGVYLAGRWLGLVSRGQGTEHVGCLPLLVTLVALLSGIAITYYVVFYGAASRMSGSGK